MASLVARLEHDFRDPALLRTALTHRSHSSPHNERLEFLGDSVLSCTIAHMLYERFPQMPEGDLSRLRANLVRKETLHQLALELDLGQFLRLGEGELKSGGHQRPSILADAFEAILGAVYLDGGFAAAQALVSARYEKLLAAIAPGQPIKDPKTLLQEYLQARRKPLPKYELQNARGEAHAQQFEVVCDISALGLRTQGAGPSRRAAEQEAAQRALERLQQP
ncbi:MAG TPA: ribonuclease III [Azospira sp.]|nr:ribonuclease III [Azospira sp.]HJW04282.1 ribonuclease III [Azospira sp.]